jgi:hypothetical protein
MNLNNKPVETKKTETTVPATQTISLTPVLATPVTDLANSSKTDINTINEDEPYKFEDLITNLKLLSQLEQEQKLMQVENGFKIDDRIGQSLARWWSGDGRQTTLSILKKIVNSAIYHSEELNKKIALNDDHKQENLHDFQLLTTDLGSAKMGLVNMIITYREDKSFIGQLLFCLDRYIVLHDRNQNTKFN